MRFGTAIFATDETPAPGELGRIVEERNPRGTLEVAKIVENRIPIGILQHIGFQSGCEEE